MLLTHVCQNLKAQFSIKCIKYVQEQKDKVQTGHSHVHNLPRDQRVIRFEPFPEVPTGTGPAVSNMFCSTDAQSNAGDLRFPTRKPAFK